MKNKKYTFGGVTFEVESPFELIENNVSEAFHSEADADYLVGGGDRRRQREVQERRRGEELRFCRQGRRSVHHTWLHAHRQVGRRQLT